MIWLHGLLYACDAVRSLGETLGAAHPVRVAFNPDDLGHIRVHDPINGRDIVMPALAQDYACGLGLHKHAVIHRAAAATEDAISVTTLKHARCAIREATAFALKRHGGI